MTNSNFDTEQLNFVYRLFKALQKGNLNYIYRGAFSQQISSYILTLAETNIINSEEQAVIRKRVYNIMVESLQNVVKHQDENYEHNIDTNGVFVIQKKDNAFQITTGNLILKNKIPVLREKLEKINQLSPDELKIYYKEVLVTGEISEKGGAGLGLIDIAKKSGRKLYFAFKDYDEITSYFYLHTEVPFRQEDRERKTDWATEPLNYISGLHQLLNEKNILIIFNSYFNQDSLLNLLSILDNQSGKEWKIKRRMYHLMVEMIQNIVKHGCDYQATNLGKPGLFFIAENKDYILMSTGNYIESDKTEVLRDKIQYINRLDHEELSDYYNEKILSPMLDAKKAGLGLIDLRLKSDRELLFTFYKVNEGFSFYTIQVSILKPS
jgi:hypothetical protein